MPFPTTQITKKEEFTQKDQITSRPFWTYRHRPTQEHSLRHVPCELLQRMVTEFDFATFVKRANRPAKSIPTGSYHWPLRQNMSAIVKV